MGMIGVSEAETLLASALTESISITKHERTANFNSKNALRSYLNTMHSVPLTSFAQQF